MTIKNRGACSNPEGRFELQTREDFDDGWEAEEESLPPLETFFYSENASSIISRNDSPDVGFEQSINPYKGCEHGCIYCYARPSHAYMNLSPGLDFETKIFYKPNAAKLLEKELSKLNYICKTIVVGANTDPYQPAEQKLKITQSLLEVLNHYHHPVTIITKSSLVERDIELLADMASKNLVRVAFSITTLNMELKRTLEPRTSSPKAKLRVIHQFKEAGIPVIVMTAPIIPLINDAELEHILELAAKAGAQHAAYTVIRLPYEVKDLFKEWLEKYFPERAEHVMSIIRQMRGGKDYDATFGKRMSGEGQFANLLAQRFQLACKRFQLNQAPYLPLNTKSFRRPPVLSSQIDLWENTSGS